MSWRNWKLGIPATNKWNLCKRGERKTAIETRATNFIIRMMIPYASTQVLQLVRETKLAMVEAIRTYSQSCTTYMHSSRIKFGGARHQNQILKKLFGLGEGLHLFISHICQCTRGCFYTIVNLCSQH